MRKPGEGQDWDGHKRVRIVLERLAKAQKGLAVGDDPWQQAVPLADLLRAGATEDDVRRLIQGKLVDCHVEVGKGRPGQRKFRECPGGTMPEGSCFLLTAAGLVAATDSPEWIGAELRMLHWRGREKMFAVSATNQLAVLRALADWGWTEEFVPSPLEQKAAGRYQWLLNVVKNLDRSFEGWPLRFHTNAKQNLIRWERLV